MNPLENYSTEEYKNAKKAVNEKLGFYTHLAVYLIVNLFFLFLNLKQGGFIWAIYPAVGWGIGLLFHGLGVFSFFNSKRWKQKQIYKEIEKQRKLNQRK